MVPALETILADPVKRRQLTLLARLDSKKLESEPVPADK